MEPNKLSEESTSAKEVKRKNGAYCCAVGCHHNQRMDGKRGIKFHSFPSDIRRRDAWIHAIRRENPDGSLWSPAMASRLCSSHFLGGIKSDQSASPSYIPSIFPTHHVKAKTPQDLARFQRKEARDKARNEEVRQMELEKLEETESCETDEFADDDYHKEDFWQACTRSKNAGTQTFEKLNVHSFIWECDEDIDHRADKKSSHSTMVAIPATANKCVETEPVKLKSKGVVTESIIARECVPGPLPILSFADKQFESFTGVKKNVFQFLLFKLGINLTNSRSLSRELKLAMFLVKLKLNCSFIALGGMFNVTNHCASSMFGQVLIQMFVICQDLIIWFDKATIQARMPRSFQALYPSTRVIIDASEIECCRLKTNKKRVQTYSHYKGWFTVKFLIGCAPSGEITFISKGFGGRTTDTEITIKSGFLNYIEADDLIMADKGFPHIETRIAENGGTLVMPPFKRGGRQFTEAENEDGYKIASVRVHVERAIERMRRFHILDFIQENLLKDVDKLLVIIAGLCNLLPDLINQETTDE